MFRASVRLRAYSRQVGGRLVTALRCVQLPRSGSFFARTGQLFGWDVAIFLTFLF